MRKLPPPPNLTALLALAALADLFLFRITRAIFLPTHQGTTAERWLADAALFASSFAGVLALVLAASALLSALRGDQVFPRSMRITVSTIGLFFCVLAGIGVLADLAPQYNVHMRISHAFLTCFLALGLLRSRRSWRFKLGITLFALPIVMQAFLIFTLRMTWAHVVPGPIARLAHGISLAAMLVAPLLFVQEPWSRLRVVLATAAGLLFAAGLASALALRFDLVQAALLYGLQIDLTGSTSMGERLYSGALVAAFASLGAGVAASMAGPGRSRLTGWGLLLMGVAGAEVASAKAALFTLCGLMALVLSGKVRALPVAAADESLLPPPAAPTARS
jgi:hypothetical protein